MMLVIILAVIAGGALIAAQGPIYTRMAHSLAAPFLPRCWPLPSGPQPCLP